MCFDWLRDLRQQLSSFRSERRQFSKRRKENRSIRAAETLESRVLLAAAAVEPLDLGDAPDGYPVTLADNGARHIEAFAQTGSPSLRLGTEWDSELDGTHSPQSDFDDLNPATAPDDEDGVTFGVLNAGDAAAVTKVIVNGAPNGARLDAWMDFNQNNVWEPSEQIFTSQAVVNGVNNLTFSIPAGALPGTTYSRYRLSFGGGLAPDGGASSGEVEDYEVKIETPPANDWDFGDAPDGYPVMLSDNGARHAFAAGPAGGPGLRLGTEWDSESDGTHSPQSDFDDLNPGASPDDEDGVTFGVLNPGAAAAVTDVTVSGAPANGAFLDAWMDFNQNNVWEPSEQIFTSQVVVNGVNNLTFAIPAGALPGTTYTRYRLSFGGGLAPDGAASSGEVEDYEVKIETPPASDWDFGDAPDGYPVTLADDGARHAFAAGPIGSVGLRLGSDWDSETDGTHSVNSTFDDLNPGASPDDEDGVTFGALNAGDPAAVTDVTVNGAPLNGALLDAWMDFNQDNDWDDPGEQIFTNQVVINGVNNLTFVIPAGALSGTTYTRYRLSAGGGLAPDGVSSTGEVEDYEVKIETPPANDWDFGDAPDGYPVTLADDGARHIQTIDPTGAPGLRLGTEWDSESDGTHSPQSDFDDLNPGASPDDEDGVTFGVLNPGAAAAQTAVFVTGAPANGALLDAWMDFNQNNVWEPSEQIFTSQAVVNGVNNLTFAIPSSALTGTTYTRYRLSFGGGLAPDGAASSGEVEDYEVKIETPPASDWDFGDAPDGYPVTLADDGARHVGGGTVAAPGLRLGTEWDSESDGTHSVNSDFDDLNPGASPDDEDGVTFGALNAGDPAAVTDVTVSGAPANGAFLDAWMDFNQDNDWNDPGEQIFTSQVVVNGVNNLTFSIPAGALPGTTYTRYRLSASGGLPVDGGASSGEVEDYEVKIETPPANDLDFGDAPDGYPVMLSDNGARHAFAAGPAGDPLRLGKEWDSESDGTHSVNSDFDDLNPGAAPDDEDGVKFGPLNRGAAAAKTKVVVNGAPATGAFLDAWMDFNQNNVWEPSEQIFTSQLVNNGVNSLTFSIPSTASTGITYTRYRLSAGGGLTPDGAASTGEVEDYQVKIKKLNADFNNDGAVDGDDLLVWQQGFGSLFNATREDGDADLDSDVDGGDFLQWQRGFGMNGAGLPSFGNFTAAIDQGDLQVGEANYGVASPPLVSASVASNQTMMVIGSDLIALSQVAARLLTTLPLTATLSGEGDKLAAIDRAIESYEPSRLILSQDPAAQRLSYHATAPDAMNVDRDRVPSEILEYDFAAFDIMAKQGLHDWFLMSGF